MIKPFFTCTSDASFWDEIPRHAARADEHTGQGSTGLTGTLCKGGRNSGPQNRTQQPAGKIQSQTEWGQSKYM